MWVEKDFEYTGARLWWCISDNEPRTVTEWLNQLEGEGYNILESHFVISEKGIVLVIVRVLED